MSSGQLSSATFTVRTPNARTTMGGARLHPYRRPASTAMAVSSLVNGPAYGHGAVSSDLTDVGGGSNAALPSSIVGESMFAGSGDLADSAQVAGLGTRAGSPWHFSSLPDRDPVESQPTPPFSVPAGAVGSVRRGGPTRSLNLQDLEMMLRNFNLDSERQSVYEFDLLSLDSKVTVLFMHTRVLDNKLQRMNKASTDIKSQLEKILGLVQQAWQPSKAQSQLIRSLIRHFLVKPIASYNQISDYVKGYIKDHAARLRLGIYVEDQTVRVTLNAAISELTNQMKSAVRKAIFASCKRRIPLRSFCRNMLDNYHLPAIPAELPIAVLGTFALLRKIAEPLARHPTNKGNGDTGFWREIEMELDRLYRTINSTDRVNDDAWIDWATEMVQDDEARFPPTGAHSMPTTRDEINDALSINVNTPENRDVEMEPSDHGSSHGIGGQDFPEDTLDGDVDITTMGDIAATMHVQ
ncbi:hypothetical protein BD311DRAFT_809025 [Dichomitus squalens]|uniref:Uncharacterized protein n=1 Tax=Dichomitus squalens TaxID=114155 RepID=A0A4Q9MGE3_9APHY|nr:hypothetical protein BD311DRAFT_809025 [Dichomitus squalens]